MSTSEPSVDVDAFLFNRVKYNQYMNNTNTYKAQSRAQLIERIRLHQNSLEIYFRSLLTGDLEECKDEVFFAFAEKALERAERAELTNAPETP
jgi:hypothetical protein